MHQIRKQSPALTSPLCDPRLTRPTCYTAERCRLAFTTFLYKHNCGTPIIPWHNSTTHTIHTPRRVCATGGKGREKPNEQTERNLTKFVRVQNQKKRQALPTDVSRPLLTYVFLDRLASRIEMGRKRKTTHRTPFWQGRLTELVRQSAWYT